VFDGVVEHGTGLALLTCGGDCIILNEEAGDFIGDFIGRCISSDGDLPITEGDLPVTGGDLPITGGDLPITGGDLPITGGDLPIAVGDLPIPDASLDISFIVFIMDGSVLGNTRGCCGSILIFLLGGSGGVGDLLEVFEVFLLLNLIFNLIPPVADVLISLISHAVGSSSSPVGLFSILGSISSTG